MYSSKRYIQLLMVISSFFIKKKEKIVPRRLKKKKKSFKNYLLKFSTSLFGRIKITHASAFMYFLFVRYTGVDFYSLFFQKFSRLGLPIEDRTTILVYYSS